MIGDHLRIIYARCDHFPISGFREEDVDPDGRRKTDNPVPRKLTVTLFLPGELKCEQGISLEASRANRIYTYLLESPIHTNVWYRYFVM